MSCYQKDKLNSLSNYLYFKYFIFNYASNLDTPRKEEGDIKMALVQCIGYGNIW